MAALPLSQMDRGVLLNCTRIRRSTQTGSWEAAEKPARNLEAEIGPEREKIEARREFTLREAVETFLGNQKARGPLCLFPTTTIDELPNWQSQWG